MKMYLNKMNFRQQRKRKLLQKMRGFVVVVNLFQVGKSKVLKLVVAIKMWKEMYNFLS